MFLNKSSLVQMQQIDGHGLARLCGYLHIQFCVLLPFYSTGKVVPLLNSAELTEAAVLCALKATWTIFPSF